MARETFREADVFSHVAMRILALDHLPNIWVQDTGVADYTFHCPLLVACSSSLLSVCLACSISFSESSASYPSPETQKTEFIKVSIIPHVEIRAPYKHCPFSA